jgi:hypothetical protein
MEFCCKMFSWFVQIVRVKWRQSDSKAYGTKCCRQKYSTYILFSLILIIFSEILSGLTVRVSEHNYTFMSSN